MARKPTWRCTRVTDKVRCSHENPRRLKKCEKCGKPRPPIVRPAHLEALKLSYEEYVDLNGGNRCGICGRPPSATRNLDRDHDHSTGRPRGLLCPTCNRNLWYGCDAAWAEAARAYLERAENWWNQRKTTGR